MSWLTRFAESAEKTDRFVGRPNHVDLLAAGLMGEAGSMLAELKKEERERSAYPAYRGRKLEEFGDFLWYFVRLVTVVDRQLLSEFESYSTATRDHTAPPLTVSLEFGSAVGELLAALCKGHTALHTDVLRPLLRNVWCMFLSVARDARVELQDAAANNLRKITSRWPADREYSGLLDGSSPEEEQLPRQLDVEFRERHHGQQKVVLLRCNGINFGDRITDNIQESDAYRFHDVFHFAYAVHLGWSPVVRALLRCKRKSNSKIDEAEDGARAGILEEAVAAVVFARAKQLNFFDGLDELDYDLLKIVREFVQGYEVANIPLWQWEAAILDGYRVFRELRSHGGGRVLLDLDRRQLTYCPP